MNRLWSLTAAAFLFLAIDAAAIKDKDNQGRWEKRVDSGPDRDVPGFLVNLGPTGARAVLTERTFVVRYLFKGSPGDGRLRPGDVILGAFGKPFSSHTFGGEPHGCTFNPAVMIGVLPWFSPFDCSSHRSRSAWTWSLSRIRSVERIALGLA